ncbi:MAG: RagB/SusD family nutrient uptake outer membrane protein [Bacteroidota bacterium]|nr:RagB/SusD family nutrient uptake outer membrane protein [Bacteroidota bacterium]
MKKNTSMLLSVSLLLMVLYGCMDVIDKADPQSAGSYIWDNTDMATLYLDKLYLDNLPGAAWGGNMNDTEEAYGLGISSSKCLYGKADINMSVVYSDDWWSKLRRINIMITEMTNESNLSETLKNQLLGQARFLRAIKYWELVRVVGGVPILAKPLDPLMDELDVPRSSTAQCIAFITADLDFAAKVLPARWEKTDADFGRLTSGAAMAYKGRVLMSFASPMFCERDSFTGDNGTFIAAYNIPDASLKARWEAAYTANKIAYDSLLANGYGLMSNFGNIFTTPAVSNPEAIMVSLYTGKNYTHNWESVIRPSSGGGAGDYVNPTWNLVKAFPMINGKRIDEAGSTYDSLYYWINRDPRFYYTIAYNGGTWNFAGSTSRKQWSYYKTAEEGSRIPVSGFYCRKASDPTLTKDNLSKGSIAWIEIRFAEVVLNLAECANELYKLDGSHAGEAASLIGLLRARAGIEAGDGFYGISSSTPAGFGSYGEYMLDVIMNERQVELAFENQRYWDLRRRMMFTRDLTSRTHKLNGMKRTGLRLYTQKLTEQGLAEFAAIKDTLTLTKSNYYTYFRVAGIKVFDYDATAGINGLHYLSGYYFAPIQTSMFSNSTALKQTIGWGYGTFDPLAE